MNFTPILLIVLALGINAALLLSRSHKRRIVDGNPTYGYPRGVAYFLFLGYWGSVAVLVFLAPLQKSDPQILWIIPLTFATLGTIGSVYIYRFSVVLDRHAIRAGAVFPKEIAYANVVRVRYLLAKIVIYADSGKSITVWDSIGDFPSCVKEIEARLPPGIAIPRTGRMRPHLGEPTVTTSEEASAAAIGLRARINAWRKGSG